MVSGSLSLPSSGCFSPFPHGTSALSVSREYLALPDGPGRFTQDSSCPALLRIPLGPGRLRVLDYHQLWPDFPDRSARRTGTTAWSYYPGPASLQNRFGLFPGRSPLLGESFNYFLLLEVLRCFSSLRSPPYSYRTDASPSDWRVVPFGNPGINGYLLLPRAYRSLSRPSSPP